MSAASERLHGKPGGKVAVKVTASRREFKGAIKLGVEGLGPDVELAGQSIPSGKNETTMTITLPAGRKPGELIGLKGVCRGLLEPPDAGETVIERSAVNYNRDELFRILIGAIVIGTVGNNGIGPECFRPGANQMVGRCLAGRIR